MFEQENSVINIEDDNGNDYQLRRLLFPLIDIGLITGYNIRRIQLQRKPYCYLYLHSYYPKEIEAWKEVRRNLNFNRRVIIDINTSYRLAESRWASYTDHLFDGDGNRLIFLSELQKEVKQKEYFKERL